MKDALAGRDVFALLPTGGGKSLCFQLPALLQRGLTVVVSPLIALMKDQVDGLQAGGIPASFLNSSLSATDSRARLRGLHQGEFKLLYVAPERLLLTGFLADLQRWNVSLLAVDEAHCISEWGHDFRPEYRQLSRLRSLLPATPMMALTATATERVRSDIVEQLHLREPRRYVASFNRPNLTYRVLAKEAPYDQLLAFVRSRPQESGIVYCQARKTAERLADRLAEDGIRALPYHAGLTPKTRDRHQEQFLRDDARVVCATIAFGMGINKPNVRFVVHYDLPKNLEGYYQETGRAGRDSLPSECLLLFSAGDVAKQLRFIEEKPDPRERAVARAQLDQMVLYAESSQCRRAELLGYFGETFSAGDCQGCDNCLTPRETYDGTVSAQKFLSCVYRVRRHSGIDFGLNHLAGVLTGANNEMTRKHGHQTLSTYGIGREHSPAEWRAIARELLRRGFLARSADQYAVVSLTPEGLALLKERRPVQLARPITALPARGARAGDIACDQALFDRLAALRKRLADERNLPAYHLLSDVTLRLMARDYPGDQRRLAQISGFVAKKINEFGQAFLDEIAQHLRSHPRQIFASTSFQAAANRARPPHHAEPKDYDREVFERLRRARLELAQERNRPAFVILHDAALREIARVRPRTLEELGQIKRVGARRAADFGARLLQAIAAG